MRSASTRASATIVCASVRASLTISFASVRASCSSPPITRPAFIQDRISAFGLGLPLHPPAGALDRIGRRFELILDRSRRVSNLRGNAALTVVLLDIVDLASG